MKVGLTGLQGATWSQARIRQYGKEEPQPLQNCWLDKLLMIVYFSDLDKATALEKVAHGHLRAQLGNFPNTTGCYKAEHIDAVLAEIRRLSASCLTDLHATRAETISMRSKAKWETQQFNAMWTV